MWCKVHGDETYQLFLDGQTHCLKCVEALVRVHRLEPMADKPPESEAEEFRRGQLFRVDSERGILLLGFSSSGEIMLVSMCGRRWGVPVKPQAVRYEGNDVWFIIGRDSPVWGAGRDRLTPIPGKLVVQE